VRAARGDDAEAVRLVSLAAERMPLPEYVVLLADLHLAAGHVSDAAAQLDLLDAIDRLQRANGVVTDLEMATYKADHGLDLGTALAAARQEYERRPSITAADALAWVLYQNGQCDEALTHTREALRLGMRDALVHYHAGMIARCAGENEQARDWLATALTINPYFSVRYAPEAQRTLAAM
jgi:tetratricopeptide (TPR) repeat protein